MIGERVSNLSYSREVVENESKPYIWMHYIKQDTRKAQNLTHLIKTGIKIKQDQKKIIWFNPPFSETVKTRVEEKFLSLIKKYFGKPELRKYFNRSTIKVSYSCKTNIEAILSGHNQKLLSKIFL